MQCCPPEHCHRRTASAEEQVKSRHAKMPPVIAHHIKLRPWKQSLRTPAPANRRGKPRLSWQGCCPKVRLARISLRLTPAAPRIGFLHPANPTSRPEPLEPPSGNLAS